MDTRAEGYTPSISLIIPAYNEEAYIGDCLEAALRQDAGIFCEVVVIDNASTDRTAEIAAAYPGVRVVREERKGLTFARQCGYENSMGEVLAYVDADTRMSPDWGRKVRNTFQRRSKLVFLSGPYTYYDISARDSFLVSAWYWAAKPLYWACGYMATGGNFAIRRSVLDEIGGFNTDIVFYGEDTAIAREASRHGDVLFTHRLTMPTSGRRFKQQGYMRVGYDYFINFAATVLRGRPVTQMYEDIR